MINIPPGVAGLWGGGGGGDLARARARAGRAPQRRGALAMRPGMSLPGSAERGALLRPKAGGLVARFSTLGGLGPGMPPVVLPPGIQPGMQPPGMPPMPAAIPGPPSLTQQQAMEYDATKASCVTISLSLSRAVLLRLPQAASTALEPEVIELVHYFKIGDRLGIEATWPLPHCSRDLTRHARMLNEQLKRRNNTYEEVGLRGA